MKLKLPTALLIAIALSLSMPFPLHALDSYSVDPNHSGASFRIRHLVSKVSGRFTELAGTIAIDRAKPAASSVELVIQAKSIDTANPNRDNHLRGPDFFDVERYPAISFKSQSIRPLGESRFEVRGTLEMHGVSKEIALPVAVLGFGKDPQGREVVAFEVTTTLNRKDFGIVWNKALDAGGYVLGDDVEVSVNIEAIRKN